MQKTIDRNNADIDLTIKTIISGGVSHTMTPTEIPTIMMIVSPRERKPESDYEQGIKVEAIKYKRPNPTAKHTNYIEAIKQLSKHKNDGINDLIYYDETQVYEGSGCSLFAVLNNKLVTAKSNVIDGITRKTLLEILKLPITIEVHDYTFAELQRASEVFVTGSNSEVRGVVEIDGKAVGNGKVVEITKEVLRQYRHFIVQNTK